MVEGEGVSEVTQDFVLGRDEELRFEVPDGKKHVTVTVNHKYRIHSTSKS